MISPAFILVFFMGTVSPPILITQPSNATVGVGGSATFTVFASGESLTYQWLGPDGSPLSDVPGKIVGATTSRLQIFDVQPGDVGNYQLRVSNAAGAVDSNVVTLSIGKSL